MFRPIAVAAKMMTWVAMDMLALDPPCVNGKANAAMKVARSRTRLWCAATTESQSKNPPPDRPAPAAKTKVRNSTNTQASSMPRP